MAVPLWLTAEERKRTYGKEKISIGQISDSVMYRQTRDLLANFKRRCMG